VQVDAAQHVARPVREPQVHRVEAGARSAHSW
jgi:hypothetical protein